MLNDSRDTSLVQRSVLHTPKNRDDYMLVSSSPHIGEVTLTEVAMLRASLKRGSKVTVTLDQAPTISMHVNSMIVKSTETFN